MPPAADRSLLANTAVDGPRTQVDEHAYADCVIGHCVRDMHADDRTTTWTVVGSDGTAVSPAFAVPVMDNRLRLVADGRTSERTFGDRTSSTYQLATLAETLNNGTHFAFTTADSIANAELIDECYRRAGLTPRG